MMLYNPYDLIIIKENVIPQENIDEIMLLTNNTKDISNATIINDKKEDGHEEDLKVRNTLWYHITDQMNKKFEEAQNSIEDFISQNSQDEIAISLYNRFGFSFHHSLSGYYADGEDALVLVLDLHTT